MTSHPRHQLQNLTRLLLIVLTALLLVPLLMMSFMMPMMGGMMGNTMAMSPIWGIGMMALFLVSALVLGYGMYRIIRRSVPSGRDPALEELRIAYARGDLTEEEFKQRQNDLT